MDSYWAQKKEELLLAMNFGATRRFWLIVLHPANAFIVIGLDIDVRSVVFASSLQLATQTVFFFNEEQF